MLEVLELAVHEGTGCEVESQTGLVRLIKEVPDIDTVRLRNKDDSWSCRGEGSASVMGAVGVCRNEDRPLVSIEVDLPDGEVEIMDGEEQVREEGRSFKSDCGAVLLLAVVSETHVLGELGAVVARIHGLDAPVNEDKISFIRDSPEGRRGLVIREEDSAEAKLTGAVLLEEVELHVRLPDVVRDSLQSFLFNRARIPNVDYSILRDRNEVSELAVAGVPLVDVHGRRNEGEVANEVLVRGNNAGLAHVLHLDDCL
mmetsp:Transcript_27060/g.41222  ORF Transcript_27060/g.41222 Transcript_27060/m.41222 type:complete len:256 (-) Transcript_27060:50-817(-)